MARSTSSSRSLSTFAMRRGQRILRALNIWLKPMTWTGSIGSRASPVRMKTVRPLLPMKAPSIFLSPPARRILKPSWRLMAGDVLS